MWDLEEIRFFTFIRNTLVCGNSFSVLTLVIHFNQLRFGSSNVQNSSKPLKYFHYSSVKRLLLQVYLL